MLQDAVELDPYGPSLLDVTLRALLREAVEKSFTALLIGAQDLAIVLDVKSRRVELGVGHASDEPPEHRGVAVCVSDERVPALALCRCSFTFEQCISLVLCYTRIGPHDAVVTAPAATPRAESALFFTPSVLNFASPPLWLTGNRFAPTRLLALPSLCAIDSASHPVNHINGLATSRVQLRSPSGSRCSVAWQRDSDLTQQVVTS